MDQKKYKVFSANDGDEYWATGPAETAESLSEYIITETGCTPEVYEPDGIIEVDPETTCMWYPVSRIPPEELPDTKQIELEDEMHVKIPMASVVRYEGVPCNPELLCCNYEG